VDEMSASEAPPAAGTGPDPALPPRTVRIYVLVGWLAVSAFLFAATFNSDWTEDFVCDKCGSTMMALDGPVLLPMPGPEIIEAGEGAGECDHDWRRPPNTGCVLRGNSVGYPLGLLFWLVLAVRMGLSLARPIGRRTRLVSLVVAAAAVVLVVGGDIWFLAEGKSTVDEIRRLGSLNAADLYDWSVGKTWFAWHIAAAVVCFGGATVWFAWMIRLPNPDADLD
jgi:hypothetical protein